MFPEVIIVILLCLSIHLSIPDRTTNGMGTHNTGLRLVYAELKQVDTRRDWNKGYEGMFDKTLEEHENYHDGGSGLYNHDEHLEQSNSRNGFISKDSRNISIISQDNRDGTVTDQFQNENNILTRELVHKACQLDRGIGRDEHINNSYLAHCSRYRLRDLLSNDLLMSIMHSDSAKCEGLLDEVIQLDEVISQFDRRFDNLLTRYNCHNGYSVKWNCDDCKKAYTDWICAMHLPFYMNGERIKPCISFCERVEQRCPYLHPITREQYGGQPVFICIDPSIPFVPTITQEIPYNDPGQCYDLCHVSDNLTELITDSLSKYDYDKCPDPKSLAEGVKNDTFYCNYNKCTRLNSANDDSQPDEFNSATSKNLADDQIYNENEKMRPDIDGLSLSDRDHSSNSQKYVHAHLKKLNELREIQATYMNQAKTHRYHADHASIQPQPKNNYQT